MAEKVSIHAPTQGATQWYYRYKKDIEVSIHAPTQGATKYKNYRNMRNFVSIHAPTQGATSCLFYSVTDVESFNPRTHAGCDYVIH